jgi:MinD-like ATPase involved in chromosome partitioning or flagellar assembly
MLLLFGAAQGFVQSPRLLLFIVVYKNGLLKNFLKEVEWGALDYLLIDSPPGTSDEHMSTTSLLKDAGITGAVIVTTPSKVALIDVQRQLAFCRKGSLIILNSLKTISVDLKIIGLASFVQSVQKSLRFFENRKAAFKNFATKMTLLILVRYRLIPMR